MPKKIVTSDCMFEDSIHLASMDVTIRPNLRLFTLAAREENVDGAVVDRLGRHRTTCVPNVIIQNGADLFATTWASDHDLGDLELKFPLAMKFHEDMSFTVVHIPTSEGTGQAILTIMPVAATALCLPVSDRFARFLELTQTLGLLVAQDGDERFKVFSIRKNDSDTSFPAVADTWALIGSKNFRKVIDTQSAWEAKAVAVPELYVEEVKWYMSYDTYFVGKSSKHVSSTPSQKVCFLCGTDEQITREHCTPRWLVEELELEPIVASIFCSTCNSEQGRRLEQPMGRAFRAGNLLEDEKIVNLWALKTALTLAVSQNAHVPEVLAEAVRNGDTNLGGAEVVALRQEHLPESDEFRFITTSLSANDRSLGRFVFFFAFLDFSFLVIRWTHDSDSLESLVKEICLNRVDDVARLGTVHVLLERLSGQSLTAKAEGQTWL